MISDERKLPETIRTILLVIYYVFSLILFVQVKNVTVRNRKTTWSCKEVAIFSRYLGWRDTFKYGRKDRLLENFSDWKQQPSVTWKKFVLDNNIENRHTPARNNRHKKISKADEEATTKLTFYFHQVKIKILQFKSHN